MQKKRENFRNIEVKNCRLNTCFFTFFHDIFPVSKTQEDSEDLESKFHGFVAAFCIALALNCILIARIVLKR